MVDFALSEEQQIFKDSVARFVADEYGFAERQKIVATDAGFLDRHWATFAELGWLALPFAEDYGGLGGSPVETMVLMEQLGRGLVMSPYLASVVLGGNLVAFAGSEDQKAAILPGIAEGKLKLAFAYAEPQARYALADIATTAKPDGDGFVLSGAKSVVFYGAAADRLVVSARTAGGRREADGVSLFVVDAGAAGLTVRGFRTQDGGRAAEVHFEGVAVGAEAALGPIDGAYPVIERTLDHAIAAVCAEATGAMWSIYEQTLEYHKTRQQFGQLLGKFQALQHRMVDVYMKCELASSMAYEATLHLDDPDPAVRRRAASAAKYEIAKYGRDVGQEGVQLHGGIGMTMDVPIGHYFKRLSLINASFGDGPHHLARYRQRAA